MYVALSIKTKQKILQYNFSASELFLIIYSEIAELRRLNGEPGKRTSTSNTQILYY